jgi:FkbM family methyltransferase
MPPHLIRHFVRRGLRFCLRTFAPGLESLLFRAYCSRFNRPARWFMAGTEEIEYGGAIVRLNPAEMMAYAAYFSARRDNSEIARLVELCQGARIFADVGANMGLISLPLASHAPGLEIYAFEPDPRNRRLLETNLRLNPTVAPRVHVVAQAAAESAETVFFHSDDVNSGNSRIVDTASATTCAVPAVRLDQFFAAIGSYPDVVKIDVEGAELRVLEGMSGLFQSHPPRALLIEVHAFAAADPRRFKLALRDLLHAAGYRLHYPYVAEPPGEPWEDIDAWPDHLPVLALRPAASAAP